MPDSYLNYLRSRGYRLTPQREMIIETLTQNDHHMTAEEIFENLGARTRTINIATVYRTLDLLIEEGLACRNDLGTGQVFYASNRHGPHIHLVCRQCGEIIDANFPLESHMKVHFQNEYGFTADLGHLSFFGICNNCKAEGETKS
ncbi:Fur family transcriptional regulator [Chloroflexota bacterium]